RSVWSIVLSCLSTIFACIYTSIHPNIPSPYDKSSTVLFRSIGIMALTLLAPEIIVAWAARQFISALVFTRHKSYRWTITHSFFIYMGGFMVSYRSCFWSIITPEKLMEVLEHHYDSIEPLEITKAEIDDSGKRSLVAKGLVVIQLSWFVIQLAARHRLGLHITPLEIGTMGFAALCLVSYFLWWYKPLNV
ncbi:hypothetical protein CONPUDRAFT_21991, partial [Coniophora puteana RWD-64-598 SS2]